MKIKTQKIISLTEDEKDIIKKSYDLMRLIEQELDYPEHLASIHTFDEIYRFNFSELMSLFEYLLESESISNDND